MYSSLREIMPLWYGRYLVVFRYCCCVENSTGRYTETDKHATVVNCDFCEIWDSNNGWVPFNNDIDLLVPETKDTHHQAQRVLVQVGALLYVYQVCTDTSEKRSSQMSRRTVRAGEGGLQTRICQSRCGKKTRRRDRGGKGREKMKADVANLLTK